MFDYIYLEEILAEIIKRVPVKSLLRFRSVSKQWKSLIDSSEFITDHSVNQTQPHHLLVRHLVDSESKYVSIVDDDSFTDHKSSPFVPPTVKLVSNALMLDSSHGLVFLYGHGLRPYKGKKLVVVWNPSVRKSVGIVFPNGTYAVGFGVCPNTIDPKIVRIRLPSMVRIPIDYKAEVFTLSSGAWRSVSINLTHKSMLFSNKQVVVDGAIHWLAHDFNGSSLSLIISFDLATEAFEEIDLPVCLADSRNLRIDKRMDSLVVLNFYNAGDTGKQVCDVWMMGVPRSSFTKVYTVKVNKPSDGFGITGFTKNGHPVIENEYEPTPYAFVVKELEVYEPGSEDTKGLGIYSRVFKMTSYTESLLLLNHSTDFIIQ